MNQDFRIFYEEYFYYILLADVIIGLALGAIPLVLGIRRNKRNIGIVAIIATGIVAVVSPVLSIIVAAVFVLFVLQKGREKRAESEDRFPPEASA